MRPGVGQAAPGRQLLNDNEARIGPQPGERQMTYLLADETGLEFSVQNSTRCTGLSTPGAPKSCSSDPVEGCGDTGVTSMTPVAPVVSTTGGSRRSSSRNTQGWIKAAEEESIPRPDTPGEYASTVSTPVFSQSMTPVLLGQSGAPSTASLASSRSASVARSSSDDLRSQPLPMPEQLTESEDGRHMLDSGSAPQLVMPSIKMPSRRPFTTTGKSLGRLKLLIAGECGRYCVWLSRQMSHSDAMD
jgi:Tfp pilus assembly protein FimT